MPMASVPIPFHTNDVFRQSSAQEIRFENQCCMYNIFLSLLCACVLEALICSLGSLAMAITSWTVGKFSDLVTAGAGIVLPDIGSCMQAE